MNSSEMTYNILMNIVREMLKNGLISAEEYSDIDTMLAEKYAPYLVSICG